MLLTYATHGMYSLFNAATSTLGLWMPKPSMDQGPEAMFRYLAGRKFDDFRALLLYGLPADMKIKLYFTPIVKGVDLDAENVARHERVLTVEMKRITETGSFYLAFPLNFDTGTIEPGTVQVEGDMAGRALGRRAVANAGLIGQAIQFENFTTYAGLEMGGYVWGQSGVEPTGEFGRQILTDNIVINIEPLKGVIPDAVYNQAYQLAQLKKPGDLQKLAALDFDVTHCGAYFVNRGQFSKYVEGGFFKGKIGLGKFLLAGVCFDGAYDFKSERQMALFRSYVGGPVLLSELKGVWRRSLWNVLSGSKRPATGTLHPTGYRLGRKALP